MKMSLALTLTVMWVVVLPAGAQEIAGRAADEASRKVMQHWQGDWTGGVAGAANTVVPHIATVPDHADVEWTLGDNFLQGTNLDKNDKPVGVWLMRHNPKTGKYQVWFFTSQGDVSLWNGTWDEPKQTMTWETRDTASGISGSGHTSFVDGRQEWTMNVTKDGKTEKSSGSLTRK